MRQEIFGAGQHDPVLRLNSLVWLDQGCLDTLGVGELDIPGVAREIEIG